MSRIRTEFRPDPARKLSAKTPDDGQRNCPKLLEFIPKINFEKLVHLVGFIIVRCIILITCDFVMSLTATRCFLFTTTSKMGTTVAQWLRCCATNWKVAGSIPAGVSVFFIDIKFFLSHYGPGVDSASNRNEYLEYFLGVPVRKADNLTTILCCCHEIW